MVVIKTKIPYLKELIKKIDVMRVKIDHNIITYFGRSEVLVNNSYH